MGGIEAGSDDEQQYLEAASGLEGLSSLAMDPEERYLMQARQHARGLAPGGKAAGSRDSSQHTRSTTEHCSEQDGMLLVGSAAAAAGLAPEYFMRAVSASGSTGGWESGWVGICWVELGPRFAALQHFSNALQNLQLPQLTPAALPACCACCARRLPHVRPRHVCRHVSPHVRFLPWSSGRSRPSRRSSGRAHRAGAPELHAALPPGL